MKKLLTLTAVLLALFAFAPTQAEAGHKKKKIGTCQHCHKSVYSYYRPYRYNGHVRYRWVPAHHTACSSRYARKSYNPYAHRAYNRAPRVTFHFGFGGYRGGYYGGYRGGRGGYCR
ncbi:MAG: hypothetical protein CMO55_23090 [Verrucomicrobiales bacterium]|nr:hypothetical protein [Verrucomicrobiales bacterium]